MKRDMSGEVAEIPLMRERLGSGETLAGPDASLTLLIQHAAAGDTRAFEQLMINSQHRVIALTWRILGNEEDARDAAQEVFLRVYKYLGRFKQGEDFYGWLYRITVNVCRDIERKRKFSRHQFTSLEAESEIENLVSPDNQEEEVHQAQRRAMINQAMTTLPEKERVSLVLRDFEGLSTEEVARIMGTRPATVRVQISSARAKVKRYCDRLLRRGRKE
jgi:RNA polymerase sigma-70 factor (ECF subfamily)